MVARRSISHGRLVFGLALCVMLASASAFAPTFLGNTAGVRKLSTSAGMRLRSPPATALRMQETKEKKDPEEVVRKFGLEAGLFTALKNKDSDGPGPKELLAKYGSAYLVTSITLSLISFSLCYVLVDHGVDVAALLAKIGIEANSKAETAGTVAIAYAAHKAASPIRFPPTVALTPLTAQYLFNKKVEDTEDQQ
mmetsp:Transcript_26248/g.62153  ORF Transcript_26248/g.62153 Transcript_26248/m.62153 type:complete len:195 (-) Transcript_26248:697-1281(-)